MPLALPAHGVDDAWMLLGRAGSLLVGQSERTDGSVRADVSALVALDALGLRPNAERITATPRFSYAEAPSSNWPST